MEKNFKRIALSVLLLLPILGFSQHQIGSDLKTLKKKYVLHKDSVESYSASDSQGWYVFTFLEGKDVVNVAKFYPYNMQELQNWVKAYDSQLLKTGAKEWEQFNQYGIIKIMLVHKDNKWFFLYILTNPNEK